MGKHMRFNLFILFIYIITQKHNKNDDAITPDEFEKLTTNFVIKFEKHFPTMINIAQDFFPNSYHITIDEKSSDQVYRKLRDAISRFNKVYRKITYPLLNDIDNISANPTESIFKMILQLYNAYQSIEAEFPHGVGGQIRPTNKQED